ncbi:MAG: hypothetical protein PHQ52_02735 [Candidatus Omnitrophica bacterium]|nr:hypothetical protein [Candidatus Omnitrophota bacterium]
MEKNKLFINAMIDNLMILLVLSIVALAIFFPSIKNSFVYDDEILIKNNPYITDVSFIPKIFTTQLYSNKQEQSSYYRPLQVISYMANFYWTGLSTWSYHVINIILHIVNSFLVFLLLRYFLSFRKSFLIALFFCIHPINSSAVIYLSSRSDLLVSFFMLSCIICFLKFSDKKHIVFYLLSILLFSISLFAKEISLLTPLLLLLVAFFYPGSKKRVIFPFFVIAILFLIFRMQVVPFTGYFHEPNPILFSMLNIFNVLYQYIKLLFYPVPLYLTHITPFILKGHPLYILSGLMFFLGIACLGFVDKLTKRKDFTFFILWAAITFLPVCFSLFHFVVYGACMAEHWFYLPSIGCLSIVCCMAGILFKKVTKSTQSIFIWIFAIYLGSLTFMNSINFYSNELLYNQILSFVPNNVEVRTNLASFYAKEKEFDLAESNYLQAIYQDKSYADPYIGLALVYIQTKSRTIEQINRFFEKGIQLDPANENFRNNYAVFTKITKEDTKEYSDNPT